MGSEVMKVEVLEINKKLEENTNEQIENKEKLRVLSESLEKDVNDNTIKEEMERLRLRNTELINESRRLASML
jgi:hypothetical protein